MADTALVVRSFLHAFGHPTFQLGIFNAAKEQMFLQTATPEEVHKRLAWLKRCNARGENIYVRPVHPHGFTLLDDIDRAAVADLQGRGVVAVVETSPQNFQAWIRHSRHLEPKPSTRVAKLLAADFAADQGSADFLHFGRLPGFTNRKPKHQRPNGLFPFVRLISCNRRHADWTDTVIELAERQLRQEAADAAERRAIRRPIEGGDLRRSISDFHTDPQYGGDLHRADFAYSVYAASRGRSVDQIAVAIQAARDLDHKGGPARQAKYATRTATKAHQTVREAG
ncbi:DNA-primase RepB domain-containing protein [Thalassobaculum salexigens]|uniref:DNA-primase RepB domain-containing protein n=1 Tax=Thalassobaculum salexigens TaxID=455360 RepID=UPI0006854097|nr:DNA-primase RepB domain-containing protein [Thalassobaculum salexigens]